MRSQFQTLLLLFACVVASTISGLEHAHAEGGAPAPPSVDEGATIRIPKIVREQFQSVVHPSYVAWVANSGGLIDCQAVFEVYLTLQWTPPELRVQYIQLYNELMGG